MGGKNEQTIQKNDEDKNVATREVIIQKNDESYPTSSFKVLSDRKRQELRIHESNGEIHFHDDRPACKSKVAVPVAIFYSGWKKLSNFEIQEWHYLDKKNNALLKIEVGLKSNNGIDAQVMVVPDFLPNKVETGETFKALDSFI